MGDGFKKILLICLKPADSIEKAPNSPSNVLQYCNISTRSDMRTGGHKYTNNNNKDVSTLEPARTTRSPINTTANSATSVGKQIIFYAQTAETTTSSTVTMT